MGTNVLWGDEYMRFDPLTAVAIEDGQEGWAPPVRLSGARNAFVSFQLLVGELGAGETARVTASALTHTATGGCLAAGQYDFFVEWLVPQQGRWYPEVCVPQDLTGGSTPALRKLNGLPKAAFAGFWVDLFLPAEAEPGDYTGSVTVQCGTEFIEIPVELTVSRAVLPAECCLDVSLNNYADSISRGWPAIAGDPDRFFKAPYQRVERGAFRAAHEHRAFLHYLPYGHSGFIIPSFAPPLAGEGARKRVASWSAWDRHFGAYFDGSAFAGTRRGALPTKRFYLPLNLTWPADFVKFGQPGYDAEWRAVGAQIVAHFKEKGWTRTSFDMFPNHKQRYRFFPWDAEEARFPADNDLHRYLAGLWKGTYDRATTAPVRFDYTLGTTWLFDKDIRSDLTSFIDVFIGGGDDLREHYGEMARLRRLGRQVWPCLNSGSMVDSVRAATFPPLMVWMLDGTGYMPRWLTMGDWGERAWRGETGDQGGTAFLYCGAILGSEDTFASVRLKAMRNALQVVDTLQVAADRAGKPAIRKAVNRCLGIPFSGWLPTRTSDPNDTDRFTEEPPLAGWQNFSIEQNRRLSVLALGLAGDPQ